MVVVVLAVMIVVIVVIVVMMIMVVVMVMMVVMVVAVIVVAFRTADMIRIVVIEEVRIVFQRPFEIEGALVQDLGRSTPERVVE
jgi:hypothetical protein